NNISAVLLVSKTLADNSDIPNLVKKITGATVTVYKVLGNKSSIVASNLSLPKDQKIPEQQISGDILRDIYSGMSFSTRKRQPDGFETGQYSPIKSYSGNIAGVIYVGFKESKFVEPGIKNIKLISIISIISLLVAIALAALFARTITTPILKLVFAAKSIASGDLDQKVQIRGKDETAQLSNTFNKMAYNLKKQEQLRDNFIATLTHDLKVPMLAENQTINYLIKEAYGPITGEQKDILELIKSTNNSSLEMVSTLLEIYRYDTGNIQLIKTRSDIVKLAKEAINQINSLALEKEITISLNSNQKEIFASFDEREIKRVLHNLISNAINNGVQKGHIYCDIEIVPDEKFYYPDTGKNLCTTLDEPLDISNMVMVTVKDNGTGISKEDIPLLFKRFSFNKGRKPAGTGLGLYYCYQVIKQHNGYIWAESIEKQGSSFRFLLTLED
ncbi:MAG: ATP-binding protein, partial [Candidatus Gastranaerophilales bacterium]|nr:ATP-binding protein [Candidatus Gastranaerophilales bacterium]